MRIAICDDYAVYREQVSYIIKEYFSNKGQVVTVTTYEDGNTLLHDAQTIGGYDIYILDVLMPTISGIELGMELRKLGLNGQIIYLTSSDEYAVDAFKTKAFNYILKPIDKSELCATLDEVLPLLSSHAQKSLIVKTREGDVRIAFNNILYADMVKRMITYHLTNGTVIEGITIRTTFAEAVQDLLSEERFVLSTASSVVNLHYISMVDKDSVVFENGSQFYIGVRAGRQLRSVWSEFWNRNKE